MTKIYFLVFLKCGPGSLMIVKHSCFYNKDTQLWYLDQFSLIKQIASANKWSLFAVIA